MYSRKIKPSSILNSTTGKYFSTAFTAMSHFTLGFSPKDSKVRTISSFYCYLTVGHIEHTVVWSYKKKRVFCVQFRDLHKQNTKDKDQSVVKPFPRTANGVDKVIDENDYPFDRGSPNLKHYLRSICFYDLKGYISRSLITLPCSVSKLISLKHIALPCSKIQPHIRRGGI